MYITPDFVVDVSDFWDQKIEAIKAFKSQFFDPNSSEPETFVSTEGFFKLLESRAREYGYLIGVDYAEGFTVERFAGVKNLFDLI
jgi:LmbE family N-acetylglucosaminyl deacetylase